MNDAPPTPPSAAADVPEILVARQVCKTYLIGKRSIEILKGIDLTIRRGEFVALRGASGAGKSTLLHLLGGLDLPNSGEVIFDGANLGALAPRALTRLRNRRIGFVFQAYHLLPELSALENVVVPAQMARMPIPETEARARELLTRVGLGHRFDHRPYELSGGEQQRVAIARCLINRPDLVLADEPTGNLDSHTGEEIIQLLFSLHNEGKATLVMATHDSRIASRAPRVIALADGQLAK
jgi:ABC-type lipoprotein export system ATPase subunit